MNNQTLHTYLQTIVELNAWPEVLNLFPATETALRTDWALPFYSLRATGQPESLAFPVSAALAFIQISIMLVDDILDDDPRGKHLEMGSGRAANLALALQAAAHIALGRLNISAENRYEVATCLQQMALATAAGQELDTQPIDSEEAYWRLVSAKSTPFYAAALESGTIVGGADRETRDMIRSIGVRFGEIIQIMDDLDDAFQMPAKPDWQRQNNNLAILFAKNAEHPQHDDFLQLLDQIIAQPGDVKSLRSAQKILIDCGAVSYCVYQILVRYRTSLAQLAASTLVDIQPILDLHYLQMRPLAQMLHTMNISLPPELQGL